MKPTTFSRTRMVMISIFLPLATLLCLGCNNNEDKLREQQAETQRQLGETLNQLETERDRTNQAQAELSTLRQQLSQTEQRAANAEEASRRATIEAYREAQQLVEAERKRSDAMLADLHEGQSQQVKDAVSAAEIRGEEKGRILGKVNALAEAHLPYIFLTLLLIVALFWTLNARMNRKSMPPELVQALLAHLGGPHPVGHLNGPVGPSALPQPAEDVIDGEFITDDFSDDDKDVVVN